MFFVSIEGAAESNDELSFHQTHHAHADDSGDEWFPDSDGSDHEGDACEHFCHAHVVVLSSDIESTIEPQFQFFVTLPPARNVIRSAAPPTPPPNI